jgi:hypothetical protein
VADLFRIEQCRSCHQPIIWCEVTLTGKRMPVDAEPPLQGGNVVVEHRSAGIIPAARVLTPTQLTTTAFGRKDLRTSHFTRCPQADRWRTRGRRRAEP